MVKRTAAAGILILVASLCLQAGGFEVNASAAGYAPSVFMYEAGEFSFPPMPFDADFTGNRIAHGFFGWADLTEHWRIGAMVDAGSVTLSDPTSVQRQAAFTRASGLIFLEAFVSAGRSWQFALNASGGISRIAVEFTDATALPAWNALFTGTPVSTRLTAAQIPVFMPHAGITRQITRRTGIRINAGLLLFSVPADAWRIGGFADIPGANGGNPLDVAAPFIQTVVYFGM